MLARTYRRALLIELLIYLAAGCGLIRFAGWTWQAAMPATLLFALALRALGIGASLIIAGHYASPAPSEHRLNLIRQLGLFLSELGAYIVIFNLYHPFEELLAGEEKLRPAPPGRLPVLLLHGYACNRGVMLPLRRYLQARGINAYSYNLEPAYADIDAYADALARRIGEIRIASGAGKLIIVAHSMGGLAARAYLRKYGPGHVAKLITLGTPHQGTVTARLAAGKNGRQMVPGNAWLQRLNEAAPAVPMVSVFSYQDNFVVPQLSAALAGAKLVPLSGIGHLGMPFSRRVREIVAQELIAAGA
jgi:pimeloyl-ACP methyl ester carboxylesterase